MVLFDRDTGKIGKALAGHGKRVNTVQFAPKHPHVLLSASADKTVKLWTAPAGAGDASGVDVSKFALTSTFKDHTGDVTALTVHPTSTYFVTASADKSWNFYDIETSLCLTSVRTLRLPLPRRAQRSAEGLQSPTSPPAAGYGILRAGPASVLRPGAGATGFGQPASSVHKKRGRGAETSGDQRRLAPVSEQYCTVHANCCGAPV